MVKHLLGVVAAFVLSAGAAFAAVDVNTADQAALDGIKGIGPAMLKAILDERKKGGDFKDWVDFQNRVKGVGEKNSDKLSEAGLTIGGKAKREPRERKMSISWTKDNVHDQKKLDAGPARAPNAAAGTNSNLKPDAKKDGLGK